MLAGTTNGRVIKAINAQSADSASGVAPVIIEELQVFSVDTAVRSIEVIYCRMFMIDLGVKSRTYVQSMYRDVKKVGKCC